MDNVKTWMNALAGKFIYIKRDYNDLKLRKNKRKKFHQFALQKINDQEYIAGEGEKGFKFLFGQTFQIQCIGKKTRVAVIAISEGGMGKKSRFILTLSENVMNGNQAPCLFKF